MHLNINSKPQDIRDSGYTSFKSVRNFLKYEKPVCHTKANVQIFVVSKCRFSKARFFGSLSNVWLCGRLVRENQKNDTILKPK